MSEIPKPLRAQWQPYVDQQIRRLMNRYGVPQGKAVERALDLRDERIKKGDSAPRYGRKGK